MSNLGLALDMTKCHKLIGVNLACVNSTKILWPNEDSTERLIPFACFGDIENGTIWKNIVGNKQVNVKFVSLKKVQHVTAQMTDHSWGYDLKRLMFDDSEDIERVNIDDYVMRGDNKQDDGDANQSKCLVLRKEDINQDLLHKIINYAIEDENMRLRKNQLFSEWENLQCADVRID